MLLSGTILLCIAFVALQLETNAFHLVNGWNTVKPSAKRLPNMQTIFRSTVSASGSSKLNLFRGGAKTVIDIHSDSEFDEALKAAGNGRLVVVDFTASWCGPCKSIAPFYQEIATKEESVTFLKVDVDAVPGITARYNVNAMPTFMFLRDGKVMDKFSGASREKLQKTVDQLK